MPILPEMEWGAVLLLLPVSLFLVAYPFILAWQLEVRAAIFCFVTTLIFTFSGIPLADFLGTRSPWANPAVVISSIVFAIYVFALVTIRQFRKPGWQHILLIAGLLAGVAAFVLKIIFGGWLVIGELGTGFAFATSAFHLELRALVLAARAGKPRITLMVLSDVLLIVAALLRFDIGDGEDGWLTILALFSNAGSSAAAPPEWLAQFLGTASQLYNVLIYVPVAITWALMIAEARSRVRDAS